jgi:hypothetical protein
VKVSTNHKNALIWLGKMAIYTLVFKLDTNAGDPQRKLENMELKVTAIINAQMEKNVEVNHPTQFTNSLSKRMNSVAQIFCSRWLILLDITQILSHMLKPPLVTHLEMELTLSGKTRMFLGR